MTLGFRFPPDPSCCPVEFASFQDPFLLLFTTPAYTLLHLSTHHCLQTQIVFNSKSAPALSTNIKLTHLINFPREFPTCIFPASRFHTTLLD
jgi:hypothetical protein